MPPWQSSAEDLLLCLARLHFLVLTFFMQREHAEEFDSLAHGIKVSLTLALGSLLKFLSILMNCSEVDLKGVYDEMFEGANESWELAAGS